jgi:hypothetical protein
LLVKAGRWPFERRGCLGAKIQNENVPIPLYVATCRQKCRHKEIGREVPALHKLSKPSPTSAYLFNRESERRAYSTTVTITSSICLALVTAFLLV